MRTSSSAANRRSFGPVSSFVGTVPLRAKVSRLLTQAWLVLLLHLVESKLGCDVVDAFGDDVAGTIENDRTVSTQHNTGFTMEMGACPARWCMCKRARTARRDEVQEDRMVADTVPYCGECSICS
jgi:hypothetical protein